MSNDLNVVVSIIIVNYNTINVLLGAICSIYRQVTELKFEIIVVDNNSKDNSLVILKEKYPDVIYVPLSENIGFGRANNKGVEVARGRNIFFLNPDTILINNAVKILSDFLDQNEGVGTVGAQLYNIDNTLQKSFHMRYHGYIDVMKSLFSIIKPQAKIKQFCEPKEVAAVCGAAMMISSKVIDVVGCFNPLFFMYAEETELCYRIKKKGYKIICLPDAKIMHLDGGSFEFKEERAKRRIEGKITFYRIVYSSVKVRILLKMLLMTTCIKTYMFKLLRNTEKAQQWKTFHTLYKQQELIHFHR